MAHYRSYRRSTVNPMAPLVAFIIVSCFGLLFVGCGKTAEAPEEMVFTQEELDQARALAGRDGGTASGATQPTPIVGMTGTGASAPGVPVVDLSQVPMYDSIRTGPSTLPGNLYRVTFDFVNIRSEPRVTAQTIGKKLRGEYFDVIDFVNSGWAKVRLSEGKEGFVSTQYLAKIVTEEQLPVEKKKFEGLYAIDFDFLNVRKEPKSTSEKLGELPGQSIIRPLLFEGDWAKVVFEGKEGYISKDYLVEFLPTMLVRQERFTLPILQYDLSQPDALDALVRHASRLQTEGLKIVTLRDLYDLLLKQEQRDVRIDPKSVVVMVTGVTPDNVKSLTDTLQRNKLTVTIFLKTKDLGLSGITEKAVLSLVAGGHDIQSAGHTGDDMRSLATEQVELELKQSRKMIEDITRKPVFAFLYAQGGTNDRVMQMAAQAGYLLGVTNIGDRVFSRDMLLRLPSFAVNAAQTGDDVLKFVKGS